jgi:uncharacterized membrane protein required for colicin V production
MAPFTNFLRLLNMASSTLPSQSSTFPLAFNPWNKNKNQNFASFLKTQELQSIPKQKNIKRNYYCMLKGEVTVIHIKNILK